MELRHRFDLHLNDEVKKFLWIATLLDPRFKKLDCFKGLGCEDLIGSKQRTRVAAWLRIEYDKNYKNHVSAPTEASGPASHAAGTGQLCEWHHCAQEAEERVRLIFQRPRKFGRGG